MGKTRMNEGEGEERKRERAGGGGDDVMLRELVFVRRQDHCAVVTGYHPKGLDSNNLPRFCDSWLNNSWCWLTIDPLGDGDSPVGCARSAY